MVDVFIGLGGNVGDRKAIIDSAVRSLGEILLDCVCSRYYTTEPRDFFDQDYFFNVVVKGKTVLTPLELLKRTQAIEYGGGRVRNKRIPKGPRTIDLDILLYGSATIKTEMLTIPHPSMRERRFVLIPLVEIEPDIQDFENGIPFSHYLDSVEKQGVYCSSLNDYNKLFS